MREPKSRQIEGLTYEVVPLPAGKGLHVMTKVAKVVAPALGKAASLAEVSGAVGDALAGLAERLNGEEFESVCRALAADTKVEVEAGSGRMVPLDRTFDQHFAANYFALLHWLKFALEVNFGDLGKALRSGAPALAASPAAAR